MNPDVDLSSLLPKRHENTQKNAKKNNNLKTKRTLHIKRGAVLVPPVGYATAKELIKVKRLSHRIGGRRWRSSSQPKIGTVKKIQSEYSEKNKPNKHTTRWGKITDEENAFLHKGVDLVSFWENSVWSRHTRDSILEPFYGF